MAEINKRVALAILVLAAGLLFLGFHIFGDSPEKIIRKQLNVMIEAGTKAENESHLTAVSMSEKISRYFVVHPEVTFSILTGPRNRAELRSSLFNARGLVDKMKWELHDITVLTADDDSTAKGHFYPGRRVALQWYQRTDCPGNE